MNELATNFSLFFYYEFERNKEIEMFKRFEKWFNILKKVLLFIDRLVTEARLDGIR